MQTVPATDALGALPFLIFGFLLYFLPTIVAEMRHVENKGPTFVINLFLGWTFIGWVVALAMAAGAKTKGRIEDRRRG